MRLGNADDLPTEEFEAKQADLMIATVEDVLTKKHQKEIVRRLKTVKNRYEADGLVEFVARINILLSLVEFAKDQRVWGTVGLVSALVMRNVHNVMLATATAQDALAAEHQDGASYAEIQAAMEDSPARQKLEEMVESNPALGDYYRKKLEDAWDIGMAAVEYGDLSLMLFDPPDYEAVDGFLKLAQVSEESDELDQAKAPEFIDNVSRLVNKKMESAEFIGRVKERLEAIIAQESVPAKYLSFVVALRDAFDQPKWMEESAGFVMLRSLFADLMAPEEYPSANKPFKISW
ncbi:MAG: hypothetical protein AAGD96_06110 [Chloroflexota bacterium]